MKKPRPRPECPGCRGSGKALYSPLYPVICPRCDGRGYLKKKKKKP